MAGNVFSRFEVKYMITREQQETILKELEPYIEKDQYQEEEFYTISNIYYDTSQWDLIINSMEKPFYKEKLRLRAYGTPNLEDKVYIEIKKKVDGFGNKRRMRVPLRQAYSLFEGQEVNRANLNGKENQVLNEIEYLKKQWELKPKMYIAYDRMAYYASDNKDLRITFDQNVRYRSENVGMENGTDGKLIIPRDKIIMEIKSSGNLPIWLTNCLSEFRIYKSSFSKYGKAYTLERNLQNEQ